MSSVAINDCYIEDLSSELRSSVQKSKIKILLYNFSFAYLCPHLLQPPTQKHTLYIIDLNYTKVNNN